MAPEEPSAPLACSVRACGLPLTRTTRAWVCPRGHSHDVARAGYVNLLQPQDRRSLTAGDDRDAVDARARLFDAGIGREVLEAVTARAASLPLGDRPVVLELGSGVGELLAALALSRPIVGIGLDLSAPAAHHAARRHPELTWVVANADRRLPLLDRSVDLVISVHARRNPAECARVLTPAGSLIVAVPAADDVIELREAAQGAGLERDRTTSLIAEHAPWFDVQDRGEVRQRAQLGPAALADLLRVTYRGRRGGAARVEALQRLDVTIASEWLLFAPAHRTAAAN